MATPLMQSLMSMFGGIIPEFNQTSQGTATQTQDPPKGSKKNYTDIIGLPPLAYIGDDDTADITINKMLQSTFVLELYPCVPQYQSMDGDKGLNLFTLKDASEEYKKIVEQGTGVKAIANYPLKVAVLNDFSLTESWSTEFGESRFEDMANVGSALGQELRFITNQDTLSGAAGEIGSNAAKFFAGALGEGAGAAIQSGSDAISGAAKKAEDMARSGGGKLGDGLLKLASGSKVDFPQVWRGSSYTPSYSFTVRLYCPNPKDDKLYIKHIISPLTHLTAFMCPESDSNFTFGFPILCKVKSPGTFALEAGYISSMDAIIGGEDNSISFIQRPSIIDLRITFGNLYNTMVARGEQDVIEERPTLDRFITNLKGITEIPQIDSVNSGVVITDDRISRINIDERSLNYNSSPPIPVIVDTINRIDNVAGRINLESLDAFADPILNNVINSDLTISSQNISRINMYIQDVTTYSETRGSSNGTNLPLADRVALKIKHGIPIPLELQNWFWNNIDTFDMITSEIVETLPRPYIKPVVIGVDIQETNTFIEAKNNSSSNNKVKVGSF